MRGLSLKSVAHPDRTTRIAIQGELGSNSHMAALLVLDRAPGEILPCTLSADVFDRLEAGAATLAVLPIENSLHGSVFEHYDLLLQHDARITGETLLPIQHHVITQPGVALADITKVLSHPVALSQCRRWLRAHPHIEAVSFYDTAGSVKHVMQSGARDCAGIAPRLAAQQYGAHVLVANIEDHPENYTRFYVLEQATSAQSLGNVNKASIAFSLEHRPGSLIEALEVLRAAELNLTKIESRPVPGKPWEYVFFLDLVFTSPARLDRGLDGLRRTAQGLKELGRYQAAERGVAAVGPAINAHDGTSSE